MTALLTVHILVLVVTIATVVQWSRQSAQNFINALRMLEIQARRGNNDVYNVHFGL